MLQKITNSISLIPREEIIVFDIIISIILILFIYNSFQLKKLSLLIKEQPGYIFVPFANSFVFGKIIEKYIDNNKLINKYTKFLLLILPTLILVKHIGFIFIIIWYIYNIYLRIVFFRKYDNKLVNYLYSIVLPGKIYKSCFENIILSENA